MSVGLEQIVASGVTVTAEEVQPARIRIAKLVLPPEDVLAAFNLQSQPVAWNFNSAAGHLEAQKAVETILDAGVDRGELLLFSRITPVKYPQRNQIPTPATVACHEADLNAGEAGQRG